MKSPSISVQTHEYFHNVSPLTVTVTWRRTVLAVTIKAFQVLLDLRLLALSVKRISACPEPPNPPILTLNVLIKFKIGI